ncbi:ion channel [Thalassotalea sp. Y01]|uniref:ion channel n=1 Tax=Thalassotalea sp. Y01 TaxID=2729613 RepID=UPI00145E56AF|nr:ion channel [Thalassotalea sp. Y01]NMP16868.1 pentapeptide repeat-containing protein [Thalassotalea sp. Y01]
MADTDPLCRYHDEDGFCCENYASDSGWCYWHDSEISKDDDDIVEKLQDYTRNGGFTRGISLKHADLSGIDLVNHHHKQGFDFSYADFYRANLTKAHLFNINLSHASLMKANLTETNLHCANLHECNLLGIKWQSAKIKNIQIGQYLKQERQGRRAKDNNDTVRAHDLFEQSEEIYRDVRKHAEREGLFKIAGGFLKKELTMRRYQMPKPSLARTMSKIVDLFCGYGEEPIRVVNFSIVLIVICALLYFFTGIRFDGENHYFQAQFGAGQNLQHFLTCLYYSVVTFTTLGYGDITPIGISRFVAAFEAFTGSFTIALFVVVFVKKMTR